MATILKVAERKDRRTGVGNTDQHSYKRTYLVEADGPLGVIAVASAFGIPQQFTIYSTTTETDVSARVVGHDVRQIRSTANLWEVTVSYSSVSGSGGSGGVGEKWEANPLNRPPKMALNWDEETKPVIGTLKDIPVTPNSTDIFNAPIVNKAGAPFSPQPEVEDGTPVITILRNEASFSPALAVEFSNAVNSDPYLGADPRVWKLRITCAGGETASIAGTEILYYPVLYTLKGKREGWDLRNANRGTEYLSTGAEFVTFLTTAGHVYEEWLDANGNKNPGVPNWTKHRHYREKIYGVLNLPNQFI